MQQEQVPNSEHEFQTFKSLHVLEQGNHPSVEEEFSLEIDAFELSKYHWEHFLKQFVEEVHPPFYLSQVVSQEVMQVRNGRN